MPATACDVQSTWLSVHPGFVVEACRMPMACAGRFVLVEEVKSMLLLLLAIVVFLTKIRRLFRIL